MTDDDPQDDQPTEPAPDVAPFDPSAPKIGFLPDGPDPGRTPVQRVVDLGPCDRCGLVHYYCSSHLRSTYTAEGGQIPCRQAAMEGQTICGKHGGKGPRALAGAERRIAEGKAQEAVRRALGAKQAVPVTDPEGELARLAGEMRARLDAAETLVADLDRVTQETTAGARLRPEVDLLRDIETGLGRLLTDMAKLGFTERMVQVTEGQQALLERALLAALDRLGLDAGTVLPVLGDELRRLDAIEATGAAIDGGEDHDPPELEP